MESKSRKSDVSKLMESLGLGQIKPEWTGLDCVWILLERISDDGAVFVLKIDGERTKDDSGRYTLLISGGPLQGDFIRTDCDRLEDGLADIIIQYASRIWKT